MKLPRFVLIALVFASSLALLAPPLRAQWTEVQKLVGSTVGPEDEFGAAVALDGDALVVGAPMFNNFPTGSGKAYVFHRSGSTWSEAAEFLASDGAHGDRFGFAVDVDGDTAVVAAPYDDDLGGTSGSCYVFERSGSVWTEQQKLLASDGHDGHIFGASVAIDGDTIVVGATGANGSTSNTGAAYVFVRQGTVWVQQQKLFSAVGAAVDRFGFSAALEGDRAVVGALFANTGDPLGGAAYVFERSGTAWTEVAELVPRDGALWFGWAVDLEGDRIVAAGLLPDGSRGIGFLFEHDGLAWNEVTLLDAFTRPNGRTVGVWGDSVVVGERAAGSFVARVFRASDGHWPQTGWLQPGDAPLAGQGYPGAVAVQGDTVVVGAASDEDAGSHAGAAYVHQVIDMPRFYCRGKTTSQSCVPFLRASGVASVTGTVPLTIEGADLIPGEAALLLYGFERSTLPFHGGTLCVKSPVSRFPPKAAQATGLPPCTGVVRRDFNHVIQSGVHPLLTSGQTVRAQWLQRDPGNTASGFGDALTNAVEFRIVP